MVRIDIRALQAVDKDLILVHLDALAQVPLLEAVAHPSWVSPLEKLCKRIEIYVYIDHYSCCNNDNMYVYIIMLRYIM